MVTITDDVGSVEMGLPIKIEYGDKVYWIKKGVKPTKSDGLFMNDQPPPKTEMIVKESDSVTISGNYETK